MIAFDMRLITAGILNSSKDCKIPTKEYAMPVKNIVGNIILVRETARLAVSAS